MKNKILTKGKWYIMAVIVMIVVMAVGMSLCTWDNTNIANIGDIMGKTSDYNNAPLWGKKVVGNTFIDSNNLEWLIVDKKTANDVVDMVLMTKYVLDTPMEYEPAMKSPDYNSPLNKIRPYLNNTWYPTIDADIREFVVPKLTAYLPHTIFPAWKGYSAINTLHPSTYSNAWLAGENEVGLMVRSWGSAGEYIHDTTFQYFPQNNVVYAPTETADNAKRIATTSSGKNVSWWTRTGKLSMVITLVSTTGGMSTGEDQHPISANYLRPCVQVRFNA